MVVPEKENHLALRACSALARAMQGGAYCALVRFVARDKSAMQLGCLTPLLGKPFLSDPDPRPPRTSLGHEPREVFLGQARPWNLDALMRKPLLGQLDPATNLGQAPFGQA